MYMIRNKVSGRFTGLAKITLLGNNLMNDWLEKGKVVLGRVRRPIERERKSKKCNNFYRFGDLMDSCTFGKQCRTCGSNEHLAVDCKTSPTTLATMCRYCRVEGHVSRECATRRNDEKLKRINYRKDQNVQICTAWHGRPTIATTPDTNHKHLEDVIANISSITETVRICDLLKREVFEKLADNQLKWQEEIQLILTKISTHTTNDGADIMAATRDTSSSHTIIEDMKRNSGDEKKKQGWRLNTNLEHKSNY